MIMKRIISVAKSADITSEYVGAPIHIVGVSKPGKGA